MQQENRFIINIIPVSQEHPMGCAVACVAALCGFKYFDALKLFEKKECAWTRGFYCSEIVQALKTVGLQYKYSPYVYSSHLEQVRKVGTIVFVEPCKKYPAGHYFLKTINGWMNPWANYPLMNPVESTFQKALPSKISYIVFNV